MFSCHVFNVEEEVVVIRNGWTPKKKKDIAKSFPLELRGGYIAVVYNKCLSKRMSITATLCFQHRSDTTVDNADFGKYQLFLLM